MAILLYMYFIYIFFYAQFWSILAVLLSVLVPCITVRGCSFVFCQTVNN